MKKPSRPSNVIKQKLVERELPPRRSRHGKEQVMLADYLKNPDEFDLAEVGIRSSNMLKVASGPTVKRGLINGAGEGGAFAAAPGWWKEMS